MRNLYHFDIIYICIDDVFSGAGSKFMHTIPHNVGHVKRKRTSAKKHIFIFIYASECKQLKEEICIKINNKKKERRSGKNFETYGV